MAGRKVGYSSAQLSAAQLNSTQLLPMNGKEKSYHVVPVASSEFYVNAIADVVEEIFLKSVFLIYGHSTRG